MFIKHGYKCFEPKYDQLFPTKFFDHSRNPFEDSAPETDKRSSRTRGASVFHGNERDDQETSTRTVVEGNWVAWKKKSGGRGGVFSRRPRCPFLPRIMLTPLDSVFFRQRPTAAPIVPLFRCEDHCLLVPSPQHRSGFPPIDLDNCEATRRSWVSRVGLESRRSYNNTRFEIKMAI